MWVADRPQKSWIDGRLYPLRFCRPAGDKGDADAAFKERGLVALTTTGETFGCTDAPASSGSSVIL